MSAGDGALPEVATGQTQIAITVARFSEQMQNRVAQLKGELNTQKVQLRGEFVQLQEHAIKLQS